MKYLESFSLASEREEIDYLWSFGKTDMQCYSTTNVYPFKIFPGKGLDRLDFEPITIIYGGNGSGKSTILNLIAEKLRLERTAPFNNTPYIEEYLKYCNFRLSYGKNAPKGSKIITSDGVFDSLLDIRAINEGVDRRREELFEEYEQSREEPYLLRDLSDLDEFKRRNEAKRHTKSSYVSKRSWQVCQTERPHTTISPKRSKKMRSISSTSLKIAFPPCFKTSSVDLSRILQDFITVSS